MTSSKMSSVPGRRARLAQRLEEARLGQHHAGVVEDRLEDDRGDRVALVGEDRPYPGGVVVLADEDQVADRGRHPRRRRDRGRDRAALVGREVVAPRHVVVPAVVVALELEDPFAAGEAAGEPDGVVGGLRPGAAEHDSLGGWDHPDEPLGELDLERVRRRERDAMLVHGPDDGAR